MEDKTTTVGMAGFLLEMGMLKRAKRSGWWIAGVKDPETIAEHSFRTAIVGSVLAMMEGADPAKVALLCVFHDSQETRVGDIPHIGRRYVTAASNEKVTEDQVSAAQPRRPVRRPEGHRGDGVRSDPCPRRFVLCAHPMCAIYVLRDRRPCRPLGRQGL